MPRLRGVHGDDISIERYTRSEVLPLEPNVPDLIGTGSARGGDSAIGA